MNKNTLMQKAKDLATEITIFNTKEKQMRTEWEISIEYIANHRAVRDTLISRGIILNTPLDTPHQNPIQ